MNTRGEQSFTERHIGIRREQLEAMEQALGVEAIKDFQPMQPGDVVATAADTSALEHWVGFKPSTSIVFGVDKFAEWFIHFYRV